MDSCMETQMSQFTRLTTFSALVVLGALCGTVQAADDPIFVQAKQAFDAIGKTADPADGKAEPISGKAGATTTPPADLKLNPVPAKRAIDPVDAKANSAPTKVNYQTSDPVDGKAKPVPAQVSNTTTEPVVVKVEPASCKTCTKCPTPAASCATCNGCPKKDVEKCKCCKAICNWFSFVDCPSHGECCGFTPRTYHPPLFAWFPCAASPVCVNSGTCQSQCGVPEARKHFDNPLPKPEMPKVAQGAQQGNPLIPGSASAMFDKTETFTLPANYKSLPLAPEPLTGGR